MQGEQPQHKEFLHIGVGQMVLLVWISRSLRNFLAAAKVIKMRPNLTLIWRVSNAALCSREQGEFYSNASLTLLSPSTSGPFLPIAYSLQTHDVSRKYISTSSSNEDSSSGR